MALLITNSLTRKKEIFVPLKSGEVRMYVCGPTVYGFTHIGNARPCVFFDVVRRYLEFTGYKVTYVSNFTDVDDKIINRAREEKQNALSIAQKYTDEFLIDMASLKVRPPDIAPKVRDHIPEIVKLIESLVTKGAAYATKEGEVFFAVRKFKSYGKLSGKNIDELLVGARVDANDKKRDPLDFSLWKPQKSSDEPAWDSAWGKGRPGWHIECSAMSMKYLGETFDIHGGGIDLTHPHHENEIAQSEAFSGKKFANCWLHNNLLTIESEKMSKSVGNILLNRDFISRYSAEALKCLLLSGHYRSPIEFSERHIRETQSSLHRFYTTLLKCETILAHATVPDSPPSPEENKVRELADTFTQRWRESMDDDLNTARVIGYVFEYVRAINAYIDKKTFHPTARAHTFLSLFTKQMNELSKIINLFNEPSVSFLNSLRSNILKERGIERVVVEQKIRERAQARLRKDFKTADNIRSELLAQGIELRDSGDSTDWDVVLTVT